jgi:hypothetical protein
MTMPRTSRGSSGSDRGSQVGSGRGERAAGHEARCACGSLLARVLPHGIELKCRRCRRHALVTVDPSGRFVVEGALVSGTQVAATEPPPGAADPEEPT